jgi:hypothetical protein
MHYGYAKTDKLAVDVVANGESVHFIGKAKIGKLSAKGNYYPQLRLPQRYSNIVGETARVFETEHEGKRAFLMVTEQKQPKNDTVLKPGEKVLKQQPYRGLDQHLSAIESQIADLKSLIFSGGSEAEVIRENQRPRARFEPASWPPQGHRITRLPHLGVSNIR